MWGVWSMLIEGPLVTLAVVGIAWLILTLNRLLVNLEEWVEEQAP